MFAPLHPCAPPSLFSQSAAFVFDRFIRRPLRGLMAISEAAAVLVSRLLQAAVTAIFKAISAQLSPQAKAQVRQGWRRLCESTRLLAWPLGLCAAVVLWQFPVVFSLLVPVGLVSLLVIEDETGDVETGSA